MRATNAASVVVALWLAGCTVGSGDGVPARPNRDAQVGTGGGGGAFLFDGGFFVTDGGIGITSDAGSSVLGCGRCPEANTLNLGIPIAGLVLPCCTPEGSCGQSSPILFSGCVKANAPGFLDPTCPTENAIGQPLPGCCTLAGKCGLLVDQLGLGCVERARFTGGGFLMLTGPIDVACFTGIDVDAGADSGADMHDAICERAVSAGRCDARAACTVSNADLRCTCPTGYADLSNGGSPGQICRDINECLGANTCAEGRCVNTEGSFRCEPVSP